MEGERREKTRVDFKTQVILNAGTSSEIVAEGDLKDISLKGIFVCTEKMIPIGSMCDIKILLSGTSSELSLKMKGQITRQDPSGLGIAFNSMDLDSHYHLKNILLYNASDPKIMEQEMSYGN